MGLTTYAIESMGFTKSGKNDTLSLKFFGCYIYISDSMVLDDGIGIYISKYRDAEVYVGTDVLDVYRQAMGFDMFVGPGGAQESDLIPYRDRVIILVKPTRNYEKKIFEYYSKKEFGVCFLYDAFSDFKNEYSSLVCGTINRCLFDLKANYYLSKNNIIDIECVYFDFFGVDSNGMAYNSIKITFSANLTVKNKLSFQDLQDLFKTHTSNEMVEEFISIYTQVGVNMEPFKEYLLTFSSMESYINESFKRLRKSISTLNVTLDDFSYYTILTHGSLSLEQKYYFVSKCLWREHTPELHNEFTKFVQIRNDLAHRGSPKKGKVIDCNGLKNFYFKILRFRS